MTRKGQPYTQEEDDLIRDAYAAGGDIDGAANELGRSVSSVKSRASYLRLTYFLPAGPEEPVDLRPWAEIEMARLMGNKRFDDYRIKRGRA